MLNEISGDTEQSRVISQNMQSLINIRKKYPNVKIAISVTLSRIGNKDVNYQCKKLNKDFRKISRKNKLCLISHFGIEDDPVGETFDLVKNNLIGRPLLKAKLLC